MIIVFALLVASPACIATGPHSFTCQTHEQCYGLLAFARTGSCISDYAGDAPNPFLRRKPAPMGVKMHAPTCTSNSHPHLRTMDTSVPDVKGAGLPKADQKCHDDHTDLVVNR